jgi:hypothetical protein
LGGNLVARAAVCAASERGDLCASADATGRGERRADRTAGGRAGHLVLAAGADRDGSPRRVGRSSAAPTGGRGRGGARPRLSTLAIPSAAQSAVIWPRCCWSPLRRHTWPSTCVLAGFGVGCCNRGHRARDRAGREYHRGWRFRAPLGPREGLQAHRFLGQGQRLVFPARRSGPAGVREGLPCLVGRVRCLIGRACGT